jgi:endonuclease/exonuclease/phosphatase family metal-dependent hydrolase
MKKLFVLLVTGLIAALTSAAPAGAADLPARSGGPYSLMQMNLCLSGLAGCYGDTEYPKVVDEAVAQIQANEPNAVTLNEACSGDAESIAARTGYHIRFATVIYNGAPLPCVNPGGRGVFGNAVLTKEQITDSTDQAFLAQAGREERRWLCVTTARDLVVCGADLSTRGSEQARAANDGQCAELTRILASRSEIAATVFAGDVNRQGTCAPEGMWTLTDAGAEQAPGIQHGYGTAEDFRGPHTEIEPAKYTDHDFLVIRSRLAPPQTR